MYDEFSQRQSKNNVTANNTCVHNLEPVRKIGNKIWLTSHGKMHVLTNKQTIRLRSLFYCLFFSCNEIGVLIPVPKGKSVTDRYCRDATL